MQTHFNTKLLNVFQCIQIIQEVLQKGNSLSDWCIEHFYLVIAD